ncbi:translation initiation factor IF-2-like [Choloepus didactylus]|uniref:translation initiation factor IF-2-like n=1 Tax=Choloepus didactylus TaxID=27675 RepID=UPI00189E87D2|nr:translation initiation factor IF-2-like [Choloepus didactylus]
MRKIKATLDVHESSSPPPLPSESGSLEGSSPQGSWAQSALSQPPSVSRAPGQTVAISCAGSSSDFGVKTVSWYRQHPGLAPKLLINEVSKCPSVIPLVAPGAGGGNVPREPGAGSQAAGLRDVALWGQEVGVCGPPPECVSRPLCLFQNPGLSLPSAAGPEPSTQQPAPGPRCSCLYRTLGRGRGKGRPHHAGGPRHTRPALGRLYREAPARLGGVRPAGSSWIRRSTRRGTLQGSGVPGSPPGLGRSADAAGPEPGLNPSLHRRPWQPGVAATASRSRPAAFPEVRATRARWRLPVRGNGSRGRPAPHCLESGPRRQRRGSPLIPRQERAREGAIDETLHGRAAAQSGRGFRGQRARCSGGGRAPGTPALRSLPWWLSEQSGGCRARDIF